MLHTYTTQFAAGIAIVMLLSCGGNAILPTESFLEESTEEAMVINEMPRIIFLNFEMQADSVRKQKKIKIVKQMVANGQMKSRYEDQFKPVPGDIVCTFLDESEAPLQSITIDNPLLKSYEYVGNNGQLSRKQVVLEQTEFTLRAQLNENAYFIMVEEKTAEADDAYKMLLKEELAL